MVNYLESAQSNNLRSESSVPVEINLKNSKFLNQQESNSDSLNDNNNKTELMDIQDIVPNGGNAILLCVARCLIYLAHRNSTLKKSLEHINNINADDLASDIQLQKKLRVKLCEHWSRGVYFDREKNELLLNSDYAAYFNNNIYDFLIQVYQASINNYAANHLFHRYAIKDLSKLLNVKIYLKKLTSKDMWKIYEPLREPALASIYMRECRTQTGKSVRLLLPKHLWALNYKYNEKICTYYFSQFNFNDQLDEFEEAQYRIDSKLITNLFDKCIDRNSLYQLFCVFLSSIPVHTLQFCEQTLRDAQQPQQKQYTNEDLFKDPANALKFNSQFNTLGKQFKRFASINHDVLKDYLNFLWGKKYFTNEFINYKYQSIRSRNF